MDIDKSEGKNTQAGLPDSPGPRWTQDDYVFAHTSPQRGRFFEYGDRTYYQEEEWGYNPNEHPTTPSTSRQMPVAPTRPLLDLASVTSPISSPLPHKNDTRRPAPSSSPPPEVAQAGGGAPLSSPFGAQMFEHDGRHEAPLQDSSPEPVSRKRSHPPSSPFVDESEFAGFQNLEGERAESGTQRMDVAGDSEEGGEGAMDKIMPDEEEVEEQAMRKKWDQKFGKGGGMKIASNGIQVEEETREWHSKLAKKWDSAFAPDGNIIVDVPSSTSDLDWLDPSTPVAQRLSTDYIDSIPRVAVMVLLSPTTPPLNAIPLSPRILEAILFVKSSLIFEKSFKSYAGVIRNWIEFCEDIGLSREERFPAHPKAVLGFLATRKNLRTGGFVRSGTVGRDISALRFWHHLHDLEFEFVGGGEKMLMKGLKNLDPAPLPKRKAFGIEAVEAVANFLDHDNSFDVAVFAAFTAGFFGLLRMGELVCERRLGSFKEDKNVSIINVKLVEESQDESTPRLYNIHLPWDKVKKQAGRNFGVAPQELGDLIDPVVAFECHLEMNEPVEGRGLFAYRSRQDPSEFFDLTKSALRDRINEAFSANGFDEISGHELRISGCTHLAKLGAGGDIIKMAGGWSSPVYREYLRDTVEIAAMEVRKIKRKEALKTISKGKEKEGDSSSDSE